MNITSGFDISEDSVFVSMELNMVIPVMHWLGPGSRFYVP